MDENYPIVSFANSSGSVYYARTTNWSYIGVGGGTGVLIYQGQRIPLSISGIGLGSLGVASVDLVGTAYNLPRPGLIAGTYAAAGAGATFVGGGQVARLQNQNGVVLEVHGVQVGFQVSIGLGGMTIALQ